MHKHKSALKWEVKVRWWRRTGLGVNLPELQLSGPEDELRWYACALYAYRAAESVISKILGKFQAGEGGGIFHAGATVPARLTPSRLSSAAGGVEAPGSSRPASLHLRRQAQSRKLTGLHLHNKNSNPLGSKANVSQNDNIKLQTKQIIYKSTWRTQTSAKQLLSPQIVNNTCSTQTVVIQG